MTLFRALLGLAMASLAWAASVWLTGGFTITIGGVRVGSTTAWRPLLVWAVATAVLLVMYGPRQLAAAGRSASDRRHAFTWVLCLAAAVGLAGVRWGAWTASGPDPYAYVSQAAMWREGLRTVPVALAADAPWPRSVSTFMTFGYREAPDGSAALVPITTPGLPLAMAALQSVFGHWAAFLIAPLSGAALIVMTYLLARRVGVSPGSDRGQTAALISAWFLATSPVLLFMVMWPMTDAPAAFCATLMMFLLLGVSPARFVGAGLAAAAGLLLRPTFATIAAGAIGWIVLGGRRNVRSALLFAAGLLPGVTVLLWLNRRWYGSPWTFGYGTASQLLSLDRFWTNVVTYAGSIVHTSPIIVFSVVALAGFLVRPWGTASRRRVSLLICVAAGAIGPYLFYEPFADWWYLRFLLPAWPPLLVGAGLLATIPNVRGRTGAFLVAAGIIVFGVAGLGISERRGVFLLNERRYATIARIVSGITDPSAVILTVQHVGTIRYYAGRQTLRWDLLDPAWLDRTVDWLAARGRHPYLLIEDWEEGQFESRFGASNRAGRLSYSPAMAWQSRRGDGWIYLFDPLNRSAPTLTPGPDVELAEPFTAPPAAEHWPK